MAELGINTSVDIDFRPLVGRIRFFEGQIEKSVNSEGVREQIFRTVASKVIVPEATVSGATQASIDALATGEKLEGVPCTDNGVTRYAYSESYVSSNGDIEATIDPVDEYGEHYGEYNVNTENLAYINDFLIKHDTQSELYDIIYNAVKDAIT